MADTNKKRGRGRPKGARNKSSLIKAQLTFDDAANLAAETLVALMKNDKDALNISDDVPATIRLQACKVVIDKAIANEKDKLSDNDDNSDSGEEDNTPKRPRVFTSAAKS